MLFRSHDDELAAAPAAVRVAINGIPKSAARVLAQHYRIDDDHGNAYTAWQRMGSPQQPTPEQYARLEAAGQLQLLGSPEWRRPEDGRLALEFTLPRHGVSLLRLTW